ncbi:MAG: hypothetical protein ACXVXM_18635 [Nocardioidaceae bacterium]
MAGPPAAGDGRALADRLLAAHRRTVAPGDPADLIAVTEEVLDQAGGRLTEGYRVGG